MNKIFSGDCLFVMRHDIPDESVDLIYLDPPFFTGQVQKGQWKPGAMEIRFEDSKDFWSRKGVARDAPDWMKHIARDKKRAAFSSYLYYMMERLRMCREILKSTGSIYLHCDSKAGHYLKMIMDEIFGTENFKNEITWKRTFAHNDPRRFGRISDKILFYTKSKEYTFNRIYVPYDKKYVKNFFKGEDDRGIYQSIVLTGPGVSSGESGVEWRGYKPSQSGRCWSVPRRIINKLVGKERARNMPIKQKLDLLYENNYIEIGKSGIPRVKQYLSEMKGVLLQNIWDDIPPISARSPERTGYPTQKPIKLLERIIKSSSNKGDLVLDPFCGCGTAIAAAERLGRRWIGIDISSEACNVMKKRFGAEFDMEPTVVRRQLKEVLKLTASRFEVWVNEFYNATKPKPDRGVDGITPEGIPIQTKTHIVHYTTVDAFIGSAKRHPDPKIKKPIKKVIIVSQKGFGDSARQRIFEVGLEGIELQLIEPKDLLGDGT